MDERVRRRTFLASTTSVAALLAGCSEGGTGNVGNEPVGTETDPASGGSTSTDGSQSNGQSTNTETQTETETEVGKEGRIVPPAIDYGELLTDFSENRWFPVRDETISKDQAHAISGKYALRVENKGNHLSTIGYAPAPSLNLKGRNFSMAVKVESPVGGRIECRFRSPNRKNRYVATRHLPPAFSGWMRIDFGITRGWNDPDISSIDEIRIGVKGPEGGNVKYWIDDIRITEAAGKPHAILAFYGGLTSHYEKALPLLEERGWKAAVPVRPAAIGDEGRMGLDQLRELRDKGWDVCSFPLRGQPLPKRPPEQQRKVITDDQKLLKDKGFERGSKHFFAPNHSINRETVKILRDVHDTGFLFGGSSAGVPPTARYTLPTINGNDYDSSRAVILRANLHNQLATLGFDEIGGDGMPIEDFKKQLDRIENNAYAGGLNVITPTELVNKYF